jgi:hypothetical protein
VAHVVEAVAEERKAVQQGINEMKVMKNKIDIIFQQIIHVNGLVASTTDASKQQTSVIASATSMLGDVVEIVNSTIHSVEQTLGLMEQQRNQVLRLTHINQNLDSTSNELFASIRSIGLEGSSVKSVNIAPMQMLLIELVRNPDLGLLDNAAHESVLSHILRQNKAIEAIWSNRADGTFIFSEPKAGLINAKGRDWWKQAMQGQLFASPVYISAITKKPCISLSKAIVDQSGKPVGVIGMDLVVS